MNRAGTSTTSLGRLDDAMPGIAALGSQQLQSSRREIRALIDEITQLAHSQVTPEFFYHGFLTRVVSAIGASSGAIWQFTASSQDAAADEELEELRPARLSLVAELNFPAVLLSNPNAPSPAHSTLLSAVVAERGPMLVPPGSVKLEVHRPVNPLDQSLIIVPVVVQEAIEYLIEIVQRPTGGPAAQRGYLRFVAQMADLFADHQRQFRLRSMSRDHRRLRQISDAVVTVAQRPSMTDKQQAVVQAFRTIACCEHALLLRHELSSKNTGSAKVVTIADTGQFDRRSQLIIAIEVTMQRWHAVTQDLQSQTIACNSPDKPLHPRRPFIQRFGLQEEAIVDADQPTPTQLDDQLKNHCIAVCHQLDVQWLAWLPLYAQRSSQPLYSVLLAGSEESLADFHSLTEQLEDSAWFPDALGELLSAPGSQLSWHGLRLALRQSLETSKLSHWLVRGAVCAALIGLACLPLPQRITVPATLHPVMQQHYFTPGPGIVQQVLVDDGQLVSAGQLLVEVNNIEWDTAILRLQSQVARLRETLASLNERLGKLGRTSGKEAAELEFQLHRAENELAAVEAELSLREQEREQLSICAKKSGRVTLDQRPAELTGRFVHVNDRLLSVYQPQGAWRFELAIPERRLSLLSETGEKLENRVSLAILGYPNHALNGRLERLGEQMSDPDHPSQSSRTERIVWADTLFPADALPVLKDGLQAQATIDCGHQPLIWLLVRDAYQTASSTLRLWW